MPFEIQEVNHDQKWITADILDPDDYLADNLSGSEIAFGHPGRIIGRGVIQNISSIEDFKTI